MGLFVVRFLSPKCRVVTYTNMTNKRLSQVFLSKNIGGLQLTCIFIERQTYIIQLVTAHHSMANITVSR